MLDRRSRPSTASKPTERRGGERWQKNSLCRTKISRKGPMTKPFRIRFFGSQSHNLKSKTWTELSRGSFLPTIENPKSKIQNAMVGIFAIVVALTVCGARAEAQQPKKVPLIGYLSITDPLG